MMAREKNARDSNNVTNLDEVRQAKAKALEEQHIGEDVQSDDELKTTKDLHGNRRFDAKKVARIKAAIAAGEYKIDPARIADKFIEHDRNQ